MRTRSVAIAIPLAIAVLGWGEWVHWRSSRRLLGSPSGAPGREAIVVLGYGNRGNHANFLNRYRVRAGVRSIDTAATESVLVFCGGGVHSTVSEAEIMACYARDELGYTGPMLLERDSMSTWENIQNAVPLVEEFDTIKIVSNSLHAEKARAYLWQLRPDLGERLMRSKDYRLGEISFVKPLAGYLQLRNIRAHSRQGARRDVISRIAERTIPHGIRQSRFQGAVPRVYGCYFWGSSSPFREDCRVW
jgi:hypothetical protein